MSHPILFVLSTLMVGGGLAIISHFLLNSTCTISCGDQKVVTKDEVEATITPLWNPEEKVLRVIIRTRFQISPYERPIWWEDGPTKKGSFFNIEILPGNQRILEINTDQMRTYHLIISWGMPKKSTPPRVIQARLERV